MHGIKRKKWTRELINQKKIHDRERINHYRNLVDKALLARDSNVYDLDSLKQTADILQLNPELNVMWNYRRDIILHIGDSFSEEHWNRELIFIMTQLKRFPKVYWIWDHRIWTLNNHPGSSLKLWKAELDIVNKLLELDSRNYHGWHYRRIVIVKIQSHSSENMSKEELDYVTLKINQNISNFSAWHQRVQVILSLIEGNEIDEKKQFFENEVSYITNAMFTDAEDQSVWFYLKWFIKSDVVKESLGQKSYLKMLESLKKNIIAINDDDIAFSGKGNKRCLNTLINIENIQKKFNPSLELHTKEYLQILIEVDPLRKNRYVHLLSNL
ncbi:hypothetical protein KAFR_0J01090 [Kazachstania africana CBS 2517]|uniref:Geranylgeranyl transferase type-2 subunit alpha n=1 Tax=Kazachstania africana (strain ATCC 22294 / BCRC 22015 / CBS 2517 / CECT 1963 / NBRC 1671 / NRRL Y-8276) TaxID=1071382 RepID=H2B0M6_KAZAF|nr:hypothetical protein KAFR_0J01090 [Kazachstania africana CBS 2517]CCF60176.1 hypothetical protein KAFR_0J01090 [Kazachstania africana CBS 2517]